jgi:hypothetical protein
MTPAQQFDRAQAVMSASSRMPAVGFFGSPYGLHPHIDAIALPHNALRRELYDAFLIASALEKLVLDVDDAKDLSRVYTWLATLHNLVSALFQAEDLFLYPHVEAVLKRAGRPLPEALTALQRSATKHAITDLLSAARKTRDVATGETRARIKALRYALDNFGNALLAYFNDTEAVIPDILAYRSKKPSRELARVERATFNHVLNQPHGGLLATLLVRSIDSRVVCDEFLRRNIKRAKERDAFTSHMAVVRAHHMNLPPAFDDIASRYERIFSVETFLVHCEPDDHNHQRHALSGGSSSVTEE